jgi:hypothetical protein
MRTAQTMIRRVGHLHHGCEITRTADGATFTLWFIGRCWSLRRDSDGYNIEIAGRGSSREAIIRAMRRMIRENTVPALDIHCTSW